jgi:DNA-binding NarL/FixJ family response regulator
VGDLQLFLTDVVMPRMGGRAVAEGLLKTRPTLKVIYLSDYTARARVRVRSQARSLLSSGSPRAAHAASGTLA